MTADRGIDLDEVVRRLREDHGVESYVEQTGGGVATLYAGRAHDRAEWSDGHPFAAALGPGWFEGPGWTRGHADVGDCYVGPDDDGEDDALDLGTRCPIDLTQREREEQAAIAVGEVVLAHGRGRWRSRLPRRDDGRARA